MNEFIEHPITKYVKENQFNNIFELSKDIDIPPIFIPSYKCRKEVTIDKLIAQGLDVVLFIYEEEQHLYSKFKCKKVVITKSCVAKWPLGRGIQGKRKFILDYAMKNKIDYFFMCDDDIIPKAWTVQNYEHQEPREISFRTMMKMVYYAMLQDPKCAVGGPNRHRVAKLFNERTLSDPISIHDIDGCYLINTRLLLQNNINFRQDILLAEGRALCMDCLRHNLKVFELEFIVVKFNCIENKDSVSCKGKWEEMVMNTYIQYPEYCKFIIHNGKLWWNFPLHNPQKVNQQYMDLCKKKDWKRLEIIVRHAENQRKLQKIRDLRAKMHK